MSNTFILIMLSFMLLTGSCTTKKYVMSGNVEYVSMKNDVLTFKCLGNGNNKNEAFQDAEINAFKVLFFRGVPGSSYSAPMISVNESDELKKNGVYFDKLFSGGRYLSFVTNASVVSDYNKDKVAILEISINTRALKQDLLSNKILSDYGF